MTRSALVPTIALAALSAAGAALSTAGAARGEPVPVANHSFEQNFAAPNSFPVLIPAGWSRFDPGNIIDQSVDALGVLNPTGGTYFPGGAPHGSNVALVFISADRGAGPAGLTQPLAAVLLPGVRYTLSVEVGNIASGVGAPPFNFFFDLDGFPGYAVQLLAGGEVVAQDFNTLADSIPEGEFRTSTVVFDAPAGHPRLGQQVAVRLVNLNLIPPPPAPGIEVDFDDVRLDASPTPAGCAADFNADGTVNPDDLSDFINAYFAVPPANGADFNGDQTVNPDDLSDYINAYFDACP